MRRTHFPSLVLVMLSFIIVDKVHGALHKSLKISRMRNEYMKVSFIRTIGILICLMGVSATSFAGGTKLRTSPQVGVSADGVVDQKPLLDVFHKFGITKCDRYIVENSGLKGNWDFFISTYGTPLDTSVREASVIQISGSQGDTTKLDDSYIQTPKSCFVHRRLTFTVVGKCSESIDSKLWEVSKAMPGKDYVRYLTKKGVSMQAKEISVGSLKACVQEVEFRNIYPVGN